MKVLNFGSLNYDYVYTVEHIVQPGETLTSRGMETFCGGKGLNQSIALAKAGIQVFQGGTVGMDGQLLVETCRANQVDTSYLRVNEGKSGHTIIQVDKDAQNCILLYGGANREQTRAAMDETLDQFMEGDILLLQNEINELDYLIERAYERKMKIILNPSPMDASLKACDLHKISIFLMNEVEGEQLAATSDPQGILAYMETEYPNAEVVLTLGKEGALYRTAGKTYMQECIKVSAVDTTAAGDTFTGYFVDGLLKGLSPEQNLRRCAQASAIAVSRKGAVSSIPSSVEVEEALAANL